MEHCSHCVKCNSTVTGGADNSESGSDLSGIVIIGNENTGKTSFFSGIGDTHETEIFLKGTDIPVIQSQLKGGKTLLFDTPGTNSLFSNSRKDRTARDSILPGNISSKVDGIIIVVDDKNLKRSMALILQFAEYGLPMMIALNMTNESVKKGLSTNISKLSEIIGVPVCKMVANEVGGLNNAVSELRNMRVPRIKFDYPEKINQFFDLVGKLIPETDISARLVGLLMLFGDKGIKDFVRRAMGDVVLDKISMLSDELENEEIVSFSVQLGNLYNKAADSIVKEVQTTDSGHKAGFSGKLGKACTVPLTGVPVALMIMVGMYYFVGTFGATWLVDLINVKIFEGVVFPVVGDAVELIPNAFIRDMIVDPDFGILTTGVFLALGLVMPVIFCFYIAFGVLEESGYIHRLSILFDNVFKKFGLNGKGVIPMIMGFSCVTMAILTTRVLNSEKEKNIASFLLFLVMPCSPLLAVMIIVLNKLPVSAMFTVFGVIFSQIIIAGYLANRIIPGDVTPLFMEIPQMRIPKVVNIFRGSILKTYCFMKEALPVFIIASFFVFLFQRAGGLQIVEQAAGPFLDTILGLPEKSIQVFIKTIVRRESGATELMHLGNVYSNLQLVTTMIVMTFIAPCLNAIIVLWKERGAKVAASIMVTVTAYALVLGTLINHSCRFLGVTFS